jgi:hypothetical protein
MFQGLKILLILTQAGFGETLRKVMRLYQGWRSTVSNMQTTSIPGVEMKSLNFIHK